MEDNSVNPTFGIYESIKLISKLYSEQDVTSDDASYDNNDDDGTAATRDTARYIMRVRDDRWIPDGERIGETCRNLKALWRC